MKVLRTAERPEREHWTEQFERIETGTDAALFTTEAKLQIRHDIDFMRDRRPPRDRRVSSEPRR